MEVGIAEITEWLMGVIGILSPPEPPSTKPKPSTLILEALRCFGHASGKKNLSPEQ